MYGLLSAVLADKGHSVYTIAAEAPVVEAVRAMNSYGVGALLVTADDQTVGIFTERDVLRRVVDSGQDPASTFVSAVMTTDVLTVPPDMPVEEAMRLMTDRRFRHLPVVDDDEIVGLVSIGDLLRRVTLTQTSYIEHLTEYILGRVEAGAPPLVAG